MSKVRHVLEEMRDQFRKKRAESVKVLKLKNFGLSVDDEWYFYPWTQDETDRVAPLFDEKRPYRAARETLFIRARDANGERIFRTEADKELLREAEGPLLLSMIQEIDAFNDMLPDVEEARKNFKSTRTSETE